MAEHLLDVVLYAHEKSIQTAFEIAVRTGTSLVYVEDGEIVKYKPPYRYDLVKIENKK
jgi:hypothetical protein